MAKAKKLPSGSWRAQVYSHTELVTDQYGKPVMDQKTGKQKEKRVYESFTSDDPSPAGRKKAEYQTAQFAMNKDKKSRTRMTFGEALSSYIESKENVLSQATIIGYRVIERNYISTIKDTQLDKFDRLKVQEWVNTISKNRSPKTVKNAYGLFASVMAMFTDFRFKVQLPQPKPNITHIPSDSDVKTLLGHCDDKLRVCIYLAAFAGLRRGEICGLTKKDIYESYITVNKSVGMKNDRTWIIKDPKTFSSNRNVSTPDFLLTLLKEAKSSLTYFDETGKAYHSLVSLTPDHITDRFGVLVDKLGLDHFTFHDLRHANVKATTKNICRSLNQFYVKIAISLSLSRARVNRSWLGARQDMYFPRLITYPSFCRRWGKSSRSEDTDISLSMASLSFAL